MDLIKDGSLVMLSESSQVAKLTLSSHPGKALCLKDKVDEHGGHKVYYGELGPEDKALEVLVFRHLHFCYVKFTDRFSSWTVSFGKYTSQNTVVGYGSLDLPEQKFGVNPDRTISPVGNPNVVWGLNDANGLVLVKRDSDKRLVFKELEPTFKPKETFKMTLKSHPGLAVVNSGTHFVAGA